MEKQVGEKNILSIISCYVFTSMGFYSFINYTHFDNFVQEMVKGYYRDNPYHNVIKFISNNIIWYYNNTLGLTCGRCSSYMYGLS